MTAETAATREGQKTLSWWAEHAWSEDTFELLVSSAENFDAGGKDDYALDSFHQLIDHGIQLPDEKFCFRVGASITLGRRVAVHELDDPAFIKETWARMSADHRPVYEALLSPLSWHLAQNSSYANVLDLDSKPVKNDLAGYLKNPHLSPERLRGAWNLLKKRLTARNFTAIPYLSFAENPSLPSDVAEDMFEKFIWVIFSEEGRRLFGHLRSRDSDLLNRVLIKIFGNRSLPRGVFERHANLLHSSLPVGGGWLPGKSGFERRRPQILMPWYATKGEVVARWRDVFGQDTDSTSAFVDLTAYERMALATIPSLGGKMRAFDTTQRPKEEPLAVTSEDSLVSVLRNLIAGDGSTATNLNIKGGNYSDDTWALIYRFLNQRRGNFFTTTTGWSFREEIFEGENVPDWLRFNVGVDAYEDEDMNGRWLFFHGGAVAYAEEMGFDGVPVGWVAQVISPAGIES